MDAGLTFAHLSDPHLTTPARPAPAALLGKAGLSYLSWRMRRRRRHAPRVLAALARDLTGLAPDHIVVTGDLTTLGQSGELEEARRWLEALGPPPRLTVVPGNHDVYGDSGALVERWEPYLASDERRPSGGLFPTLRVRGPVAFIGVSSARPSPPGLAVGTVGRRQRDRLATVLAETGRRGLVRVVLVHHPLLPGTVSWRRRLTDAPAVRAVLSAGGAELVLHGHTHRIALGRLAAGPRAIPVVGVPSASTLSTEPARRARYYLYRLRRQADGWWLSVEVRMYSPELNRFTAEPESPARLHCRLGPAGSQ